MKFDVAAQFLESVGGKIRVTIIKQGRSTNGVNWHEKACRKVADLMEGVAVRATAFDTGKVSKFFNHFRRYTMAFPWEIQRQIPKSFPNTIVGQVTNPVYIENANPPRVDADFEMTEDAGWLRNIIELGFKVGTQCLGLSVDMKDDGSGHNDDPHPSFANGLDVVQFPGAGGGFTAILESWDGHFSSRGGGGAAVEFYELICKALPDRRDEIEKLIPEDKRDGLTFAILESVAPDIATALQGTIPDNTASGKSGEGEKTKGGEPEDAAAKVALLEAAHGKGEHKDKKKRKGFMESGCTHCVAADTAEKAALGAAKAVSDDANARIDTMLLESALKDVDVGDTFKGMLRAQFAGQRFDPVAFDTALGAVKKGIASIGRSAAAPEPAYLESVPGEGTSGDKVVQAVDDMLSEAPGHLGPRAIYQMITGDVLMQGRKHSLASLQGKASLGLLESIDFEKHSPSVMERVARAGSAGYLEAIISTGWTGLVTDRMNKRLAKLYRESNLTDHLIFTKVTTVSDFKVHRREKYGEYNDLSTVAQDALYSGVALTSPSEDTEATLQLVKKGGFDTITWEAVVDDDLGAFTRIPNLAAKAARRTEYKAAMDILGGNAAIYTTNNLFDDTNHGNLQALALSESTLWAARRKMRVQQDIDSRFELDLRPRYVVHGVDVTELVNILVASMNRPGSFQPAAGFDGTANITTQVSTVTAATAAVSNPNGEPNINQQRGLIPIEVPYWSDSDRVIVLADGADVEYLEMIKLVGHEDPELFVQDVPNVGSFFDRDRITYKVRHIYDVDVIDYRGFQGIIP